MATEVHKESLRQMMPTGNSSDRAARACCPLPLGPTRPADRTAHPRARQVRAVPRSAPVHTRVGRSPSYTAGIGVAAWREDWPAVSRYTSVPLTAAMTNRKTPHALGNTSSPALRYESPYSTSMSSVPPRSSKWPRTLALHGHQRLRNVLSVPWPARCKIHRNNEQNSSTASISASLT